MKEFHFLGRDFFLKQIILVPSLLLSVQGKVQGEDEGKEGWEGCGRERRGRKREKKEIRFLIPEEVKVWNQAC